MNIGCDLPSAPQATAFLGDAGNRLIDFIRQGYSQHRACELAGVSADTLHWWLLKGGDPGSRSKKKCDPAFYREPYRSFALRVDAARKEGKRHSPPGPPRGRAPALISPEQQATILGCLTDGFTYHAACRQASVTLSTFVSWLRLGGYPRRLSQYRPLDPAYIAEPYQSFAQAVLAAEEAYFAPEA